MAVLAAMIDQGVIPIVHHPDTVVCRNVIQACVNGGAMCVEFTNRGDFAAYEFYEMARYFASTDPNVIMGAGSVVDSPTAAIYIASGARFVVGPGLNPGVAKLCNRRKIPYTPGCASVTEITRAEELGCEIVKMFPGDSVGGPDFVKAILGPCPWTRIMATGGVDSTEESLRRWFEAGVACVGIGSKLITKELLVKQDYEGIQMRIRNTLQLVRAIRDQITRER